MYQEIGGLIRSYRQEKGLSQLDVEVGIGAATGSLTKIEAGKINPSKETLFKLIEFFELPPVSAIKLFNIDISFTARFVGHLQRLQRVEDLEKVIEIALDEMIKSLGLIGGALFLLEGEELLLKALSSNGAVGAVKRLIPNPHKNVRFKVAENQDSLIVKCLQEQKQTYSHELYEFVRPSISLSIARRAQKIISLKELIALPIVIDDKSVGVIAYGASSINHFRFEIELIELVLEEITKALSRIL